MKIFKRVSIVVFVLFALMIMPFFVSPILNNVTLNKFSKQLYNVDLPDTIVIDKFSTCGKLNGNGNGMDFLACILIKTSLSYEELEEQIAEACLMPAKEGASMQYGGRKTTTIIDMEIIPVTGETIDTQFLEREHITFDALRDVIDYEQLFAVIIYDGGYSAGFDLRGH